MESPAGVGWSYSNTSSDYNCGDASTGKGNAYFHFLSCSVFIRLLNVNLFYFHLMDAVLYN